VGRMILKAQKCWSKHEQTALVQMSHIFPLFKELLLNAWSWPSVQGEQLKNVGFGNNAYMLNSAAYKIWEL